ncbi:MAG: HAD family hydrolase [archaeon]|jgi:FMN phosphatase YigB (HAD superfamily)
MVKALFFDLSDTLQEFDWSKQWSLLQKIIKEETGLLVEIDKLKQKYQQVYESYRLHFIKSDSEFFDLFFRQLGLFVSKKQIKKIVPRHLAIRKEFTWLPEKYDSTLMTLRKHFKLVIVSSGVFPWGHYDYEKIFGFKMQKHFDLLVTSYDYGYLKESGKLFEIALKKLSFPSSEAAFVGNSYVDDVLVAKNFGLKTVFLNKKKEGHKGDVTIQRLSDLADKINELKKL